MAAAQPEVLISQLLDKIATPFQRLTPFSVFSNSIDPLRILSYISTSGLVAAIFKNRFPVTSDSIQNGGIELLDPENGGLDVETELLSCLEAEI